MPHYEIIKKQRRSQRDKRFESDIEAAFLSTSGYTKGTDTYDPNQGLYVNTLIDFIQTTQPKEWTRFEKQNQVDPIRKSK